MKLLKKFWPLVLIFVVWFIFASPYFIKQKVPFPSTYLVNFFSPWNAYQGFASPVKNNAMPDVISQMYPWKTYTMDSLLSLQIPLWNPYSFSGTPHLANYQSAVLSPFNFLFLLLPFIDAWSSFILLQPLLAGLFTYFCLRALNIGKEGSVIGSLAFMFCGFITTWMAYGTLAYAILYLPLGIYSVEKYYSTKKTKFLILLSISFPLSLFSGHFQISIYFLIFVVSYLFYKYFVVRSIKEFLWTLTYSLVGIFLSFPQLLPSIELYTQSLRSGIFQKIEVIPWAYLPTFVAPDFLGNPVTRNDWFGHYAEWNAYIGLVPLMLAFYAIFRKQDKQVLFFTIMGLLAILFSFQTPFLDFLVTIKVPVLSTSAASRIIVLFSFAASVMASMGFDALFEDLKKKKAKYVLSLLAFFAVIFASLWFMVLLKLFIPLDKIIIARQNLLLPSILFFVFSIVILVPLFYGKNINKNFSTLRLASVILIIIVSFDMLRFANKWMPFDPRNLMYPNIPVVNEFAKISGYDRVLGNIGGEATIYYRLPSVEGYDAVYIKRYGEFIASLESGILSESARSVVAFPKNGLDTPKAINLMGIKYVVHKISDGHAPWAFPFWTYKDDTFSLLYNDGSYQVFRNNNAFPRVFLVNNYTVENNPQKILDKMFSKDFDLEKEVVLEQNPQVKFSGTGSSEIVKYSPNKIIISTVSGGNELLFLSDTFYPGWQALVDGKNTTIYRADYTFRAISVPAGKHNIEFIYNPLSFKLGLSGAVLGLLILLGLEVGKRKNPTLFPKI